MRFLLATAKFIDALNEHVGRIVLWLVFVTTAISAGNAIVRKAFDLSSNAWLEIQWYLFAAIFLLAAGYTLKHHDHVRVDVLFTRLTPRAQAIIDLAGSLLFLVPFCVLMIYLSWPIVVESWTRGEVSADAGGLVRWPVKAMVPAGFALLGLQGISEAIKRIAFLRRMAPLDNGSRMAGS